MLFYGLLYITYSNMSKIKDTLFEILRFKVWVNPSLYLSIGKRVVWQAENSYLTVRKKLVLSYNFINIRNNRKLL